MIKKKVDEIKKQYHGELWTYQLMLPTSDKESVWAQRQLWKKGFFFSGLRPLCNKKEQLFMQYIGDVKFYFDEFVLTDNFRLLVDRILDLKGVV